MKDFFHYIKVGWQTCKDARWQFFVLLPFAVYKYPQFRREFKATLKDRENGSY
jgi:hypothetical protein